MPFEIIRNNIANVMADAIVNTANPRPVVGDGTDAAIHAKAGPGLLDARKKIGDIPVGACAVTPAFNLKARYVIHTVGPVWRGGNQGECQLLERCFRSSLETAAKYGCLSIAFPLISTGAYGFPHEEALQIAIQTFSKFLMHHDMHIYLVVWNREAFSLSRNLFHDVKSYIDEHYIDQTQNDLAEYFSRSIDPYDTDRDRRRTDRYSRCFEESIPAPCTAFVTAETWSSQRKAKATRTQKDKFALSSLDDLLAHTDAGFSETLLRLIDKTGKKDSEIYKKANVSKQHFSKIRNNPDYKPTKPTAVAFAIALELDLEQTKDLIGRAGYALTNSSKFDVIIMYFISQGNYDIFDINMTLFEFDQMTLGV